MYSFSVKIGLL